MALEMRSECERCRLSLGHQDEAFVCSLECTYCASCAEVLGSVCQSCSGELVRRPRRTSRQRVSLEVTLPIQGMRGLKAVEPGSTPPIP